MQQTTQQKLKISKSDVVKQEPKLAPASAEKKPEDDALGWSAE